MKTKINCRTYWQNVASFRSSKLVSPMWVFFLAFSRCARRMSHIRTVGVNETWNKRYRYISWFVYITSPDPWYDRTRAEPQLKLNDATDCSFFAMKISFIFDWNSICQACDSTEWGLAYCNCIYVGKSLIKKKHQADSCTWKHFQQISHRWINWMLCKTYKISALNSESIAKRFGCKSVDAINVIGSMWRFQFESVIWAITTCALSCFEFSAEYGINKIKKIDSSASFDYASICLCAVECIASQLHIQFAQLCW